MSLNWYVDKVKDFKNTCYVKTGEDEDGEPTFKVDPYLEVIIWAGLATDLSGVTKKNLDEWVFRLECLRIANMGFAVHLADGTEEYITREHLEKFVGLSTNVSAMRRASWLKKLGKIIEREANGRIRRRKQRQEAA